LERIVEHVGPAPASDVLTRLLKGSHFNFVLIGSPQHPNDLQQVVLTPRVDTDAPVVAVAAPIAAPAPAPMQSNQAGVADAYKVYTGPQSDGPQPRSRDELRELMKERAREIRGQSPPANEPQPAQADQTQPAQAQPVQAQPTDSQPAAPLADPPDPPAPQPQ
jgi:hypothetical protein